MKNNCPRVRELIEYLIGLEELLKEYKIDTECSQIQFWVRELQEFQEKCCHCQRFLNDSKRENKRVFASCIYWFKFVNLFKKEIYEFVKLLIDGS